MLLWDHVCLLQQWQADYFLIRYEGACLGESHACLLRKHVLLKAICELHYGTVKIIFWNQGTWKRCRTHQWKCTSRAFLYVTYSAEVKDEYAALIFYTSSKYVLMWVMMWFTYCISWHSILVMCYMLYLCMQFPIWMCETFLRTIIQVLGLP